MPLKAGTCGTPASRAGISLHLMTHFRAGKHRSGDVPARANRSATVVWAVSVALHVIVLALAADRPWFFSLEIGAPERPGDLPVRERIVYLSVTVPDAPTMRRATRAYGAARRLDAAVRSTAVDLPTPSDSMTGGRPASVATSPGVSAPIVDAPSRTRAWLTPSQRVEGEAHGESIPFSEWRTGLRAAFAAAADSIKRAQDHARAASDWTMKTGRGFRLGVSPMRIHLGLFEVPVPVKVVSLRDFDPLLRTRRLMLDEVYEQRDRALRDSIVTESVAAIRARSRERARSPQ